jgi:hypothetical protein
VTAGVALLLLAGCASSDSAGSLPPGSVPVSKGAAAVRPQHATPTPTGPATPLRAGERFEPLEVPGGPSTPSAPGGSVDDYHCVLLDPRLAADTFVTGTDVLPGNPAVVHHAILFRVEPDQVAEALSLRGLTGRCGGSAGRTVAGLQLLCGRSLTRPRAGNTQHCDRRVDTAVTVQAVAGHLHLLGRSISVTLNPGQPRERTLLNRRVWDFDNQGATPLAKPARVGPGDTLRVTCTHDATLRSMLPELQGQQPRYVTWGEGTADEMCLGIVLYTAAA